MKRCIRSSTGYNVSWYTQDGRQSGAYVEVPDNVTDEYNYIEHHLKNKYKEDFGGIADYIPEYDAVNASSVTAMTEEEMLDDAILNGRPFDLDTFSKYKVDPYRAKGAVKADALEVGDIIQVTEDAAEIDCPSPEIEIMDIRYDDPDEFGHDCMTFYCYDNETGDEYTLHFWPDEWVGPIIARKSAYSVTSSEAINSDSLEDEYEWSPFQNRNYLVVAGPYSDIIFRCDDPRSAITHWFNYQKKYPTDVSISCPTKELAVKLVKAGTSKYLTTLYDKYPDCPYKLDYLIEECKRAVANGCRGFYENDYGYGDSVHPFTVG